MLFPDPPLSPINKKGQSWTMDYASGLVLFLFGFILVIGILQNNFADSASTQLQEDVQFISEQLMTNGYPEQWVSETVIQPGLLYEGRLSLRKIEELSKLSDVELYQLMPTTNNYYFVIETNGIIEPIGDDCGIGNNDPPQTTISLTRNKAVAYYSQSSGTNDLEAYVTSIGGTLYQDSELFTLLNESYKYELIIFEDPQLDQFLQQDLLLSLSEDELREQLSETAQYGPDIILLGELGIPLLGSNVSLNGTESGVVNNNSEDYFLLNGSATINFTGSDYKLSFFGETDQQYGSLGGAQNIEELVPTLSATWTYNNARIYYFPTATGTYTELVDEPLGNVLQAGINSLRIKSTINCSLEIDQIDTENLIHIERIVAGTGTLKKIRIYGWTND